VALRGRAKPVDLFEPAPEFPREDADALAEAMELLESDRAAAIAAIAQLAAKHSDDKALQNLLFRSQHLGEENAYALD
jgi:adenylate cyclase